MSINKGVNFVFNNFGFFGFVKHRMSGMTARLALAVLSSACWSGFQHGYYTGVLNTPRQVMSQWLQESLPGNASVPALADARVTGVWAVVVAIYCVGGALGGLLTGVVADRFGRKGGLLLNNVFVLAGAACQAGAKAASSSNLLIVGRLLVGINSGLNAGLAPLYISEISPLALRGSLGTVYQLVITISILLSQALGLQSLLGTPEYWPLLLALPVLPALIQCVTLPLCPESPRYLLLNRGQELHAQRALSWLRGDESVHAEMEEMHQEAEKNKVCKKVTVRELFGNRALRQPLLIAMVVMAAQQLSGINAVIYFSTDIFLRVQLSGAQAQYASLGVGGMNVVATVASLALVERAGRRTLLLTGLGGMCLCTVALCVASSYSGVWWVSCACVALVALYVVMFAAGPGPIPWFLVTELFSQSARPGAAAGAVCVNWLANFSVGLAFLPLQLLLGTNVFIIFAVLQVCFFLFIRAKLPETRGRPADEVAAMFRQQM